jgi:RimJ/RimL family protein N-acetyltransferase
VSELEHLADGTAVVVRAIRPDDKARLTAGLARLSPQSTYARFLAAKPRFSAAELRYLTEVDGLAHVALVATLAEDPDRIVAVARFVRDPLDPRRAEAAIVVGDPWQGIGFGKRMAARLAAQAAARGVRRFTATMLPDNRAAHAIFRILAEHLTQGYAGGVRELVAELPAELAAEARAQAAAAELAAAA